MRRASEQVEKLAVEVPDDDVGLTWWQCPGVGVRLPRWVGKWADAAPQTRCQPPQGGEGHFSGESRLASTTQRLGPSSMGIQGPESLKTRETADF